MTRLLPVLVLVGAASACGPIRSTSYLIDADVALQAARTAGADQYAPFEFTSAQLYLLKAREEVGYSDYEVALDFAKKASKFANEARDKSLAAAGTEISSPPPSND
ncbi:MAG TPA: DUF4398 domain-containing protein [Myxococcaceae bacterium]|jgi:hypothetical protein|nr:DUF4398 domain-containing protein [Myxococcaceae bacterium]